MYGQPYVHVYIQTMPFQIYCPYITTRSTTARDGLQGSSNPSHRMPCKNSMSNAERPRTQRRLSIRAVLSRRRAAAALAAIAHIVIGTRRGLAIPRVPPTFQESIAHLPPHLVTRALRMPIICFSLLSRSK